MGPEMGLMLTRREVKESVFLVDRSYPPYPSSPRTIVGSSPSAITRPSVKRPASNGVPNEPIRQNQDRVVAQKPCHHRFSRACVPVEYTGTQGRTRENVPLRGRSVSKKPRTEASGDASRIHNETSYKSNTGKQD
jgi:hypothetical protein